MDLSSHSDHELLSAIASLCGSQRELTAKLVVHLAEVEERRLHLTAGFSSMFEFCVKQLRMSEGEAFRRIVAARLARRFPRIYGLLASGAIHLSALELLREHLTPENHAELLECASGRSKSELQQLLATRFPKADVPPRIRKLPALAPALGNAEFQLESPPPEPTRRALISPLSEARFKIEFTASAELRDKLELARDLMSHANPSRALEVVLERALDLLLADLERKKLGKVKRPPRNPRKRRAKPGLVSRAVRREVFERDGVQCTYVSPDGRRCEARAFLELDHVEPKGRGGHDDGTNLRVRCRAHNLLWAEQAYGREHVERRRNLRQQKCRPEPADSAVNGEARNAIENVDSAAADKVRRALMSLGFHEVQARSALLKVSSLHGTEYAALSVDELLRKALLVIRDPASSRCLRSRYLTKSGLSAPVTRACFTLSLSGDGF